MIALLLAAQLSAAMPADPADIAPPDAAVLRPAPAAFGRRGLPVHPEVLCPSTGPTEASTPSMLLRPQDRRDARAKKLGDLPKANREVAVARTIGGCAVPVGVRYSVEGDGRFASGR